MSDRPIPPSDENGRSRATPSELTLHLCGPSKTCLHVYDKREPIIIDGLVRGDTLVCSKCGRSAFEEAAWL